MTNRDTELLRQYVEERSEPSFTELVQLHVNLVYGAALRQVHGDVHRARDVTQVVFNDLARKAGSLTQRSTLTGWLHTCTRLAAAATRRAERTRQKYEHEAALLQPEMGEREADVAWEALRPWIDDAIHALNERDREAVLLRFFEGRPFREIGAVSGLSPDAARMRVERALEKLRVLLARRGIISTAAAIGLTLEHATAAAAPHGLAAAVAAVAIPAGHCAAAGGVGIISLMNTLHIGPVCAIAAAAVAVSAAFYQSGKMRAAQADLAEKVPQRELAATRVRQLDTRREDISREIAVAEAAAREKSSGEKTSGNSDAATAVNSASAAAAGYTMAESLQAGKVFLAAHPEARRMVEEHVRMLFENRNGAALRALNLSDAEYERIIVQGAKQMQGWLSVGELTFAYSDALNSETNGRAPSGSADAALNGNVSAAADNRDTPFSLRDALGEAQFQQFVEYQRTQPLRALVAATATAMSDTNTPLTPRQANALMEILRQSPLAGAPNWDATLQQVGTVLLPAQLSAFDAAVAQLGPAQVSTFRGAKSSAPRS